MVQASTNITFTEKDIGRKVRPNLKEVKLK